MEYVTNVQYNDPYEISPHACSRLKNVEITGM